MPVLIKHCSLMIDKEKPGVVPAIVFIRVFDALVAYSNFTNVNTDKNKGVIGNDDIYNLKSPSQLTHNGFYRFVFCSADVNNNLDSGAGSFTVSAK